MNRWKEEDLKFLKENYNNLDKYELSKILNRSVRAIEIAITRKLKLSMRDIKKEVIRCLNCNKELIVLKSSNQKYCSHSCAGIHTQIGKILPMEVKRKISNTMIGISNANKGRIIKKDNLGNLYVRRPLCKNCGRECKTFQRIYCSRECKDSCKHYKEEMRKLMLKRIQDNPDIHPNRLCANMKESYPEKMLTSYLISLNLIEGKDFIKQFKYKNYYIDFVFPLISLAIEVDGKRWHDPSSEKEIEREIEIKKEYDLIRLDAQKLVRKKYNDYIKEILNIEE